MVTKTNVQEKPVKALVLLSGGLDSTLAARIMLNEGVNLEAVSYVTPFCDSTGRESLCPAARGAARQLGIELHVFSAGEDYLEIIRNPRYGYGKNMNPCIDCRIYMFRRARALMDEIGASFLVTGEVLGERPMSQRREAIRIIERDAGAGGLVLRPLSAQHFAPTLPERQGWVRREKLLALRGRSRKPQLELVRKFGITDYSTPAGGCLLTDPQFAARLKDLLLHGGPTMNDVHLLKVGRHVRLSPQAKAIIGRSEAENKKLVTLFQEGDFCLEMADCPGPLTIVRGRADEEVLKQAAALTVRYSKARNRRGVEVDCRKSPERTAPRERAILVSSACGVTLPERHAASNVTVEKRS